MPENHIDACRPTPQPSFLRTVWDIEYAYFLRRIHGRLRIERCSIVNCQGHKNPPNPTMRIDLLGRDVWSCLSTRHVLMSRLSGKLGLLRTWAYLSLTQRLSTSRALV